MMGFDMQAHSSDTDVPFAVPAEEQPRSAGAGIQDAEEERRQASGGVCAGHAEG